MGSQFDELCDDDNKIVQLNSKNNTKHTENSKQNWQTQTWLCKNKKFVNKIK